MNPKAFEWHRRESSQDRGACATCGMCDTGGQLHRAMTRDEVTAIDKAARPGDEFMFVVASTGRPPLEVRPSAEEALAERERVLSAAQEQFIVQMQGHVTNLTTWNRQLIESFAAEFKRQRRVSDEWLLDTVFGCLSEEELRGFSDIVSASTVSPEAVALFKERYAAFLAKREVGG
jgi:hypothetical protein